MNTFRRRIAQKPSIVGERKLHYHWARAAKGTLRRTRGVITADSVVTGAM